MNKKRNLSRLPKPSPLQNGGRVNRSNGIFDNLDYKPKNEIKNLNELTKLI